MPERRILIADADAKVADDFRQALGSAWTVVVAATGHAALTEMQGQPCEVVIADLDLPELSGAEVLDLIRVAHPRAIRFLTASDAQKERAMCHVAGGNQFLAKPLDTSTLKTIIDRCLAVDHCIINDSMRELIGRIRAFPTIPSLYLEVVNALNSPDATTTEVGAIVAKDMAMTTQLLQMLNSAYFSLPRTITDPAEAVGLLGFETVKSLVMSVKLRGQFDKVKPIYFSIDNVWRHSTNVARLAKELAVLESGDAAIAATAYTAGLLHDLGKIVLAANFDGQYNGVYAIARKNKVQLCEVESDFFGANHGQIAAYLFSLWGMPDGVIEAAALHHDPSRSLEKSFTALTAIHVANVLEHEENADPDDLLNPVLDLAYLRELGLEERLPDWRRALGASASAPSPSKASASAAKSPAKSPAKSVPAPKVSAPVPSRAQPSTPWPYWRWLAGGISVAVVVLLLCRLAVMRVTHDSAQASQEPVANPVPQATAPPAPAPIIATAAPAPKEAPAPAPVAAKNDPPPTDPAPVPAKRVRAEDLAFKDLKLQGIFYAAGHPSAILNGKVVQVNQHGADFLVVDISRTAVTVEYQNERRAFTLK